MQSYFQKTLNFREKGLHQTVFKCVLIPFADFANRKAKIFICRG